MLYFFQTEALPCGEYAQRLHIVGFSHSLSDKPLAITEEIADSNGRGYQHPEHQRDIENTASDMTTTALRLYCSKLGRTCHSKGWPSDGLISLLKIVWTGFLDLEYNC